VKQKRSEYQGQFLVESMLFCCVRETPVASAEWQMQQGFLAHNREKGRVGLKKFEKAEMYAWMIEILSAHAALSTRGF